MICKEKKTSEINTSKKLIKYRLNQMSRQELYDQDELVSVLEDAFIDRLHRKLSAHFSTIEKNLKIKVL